MTPMIVEHPLLQHKISLLRNKPVSYRLFNEIAPVFKDVQGGYTRITKLGPRPGDAAPMVLLELSREVPVAAE